MFLMPSAKTAHSLSALAFGAYPCLRLHCVGLILPRALAARCFPEANPTDSCGLGEALSERDDVGDEELRLAEQSSLA